MMPGTLTFFGFMVCRSAIRSTCAMTKPPQFFAAIAWASISIVRASLSMVMFPSVSAVVPRMMATSSGGSL
jgi:hypothetical protein